MHDFGDLDQELVTRVLDCALRVSIGYRRVMLTAKGRPSSPVCLFISRFGLSFCYHYYNSWEKEKKKRKTLHCIA